MIKKVLVPGLGTIDVELEPSEFCPEGKVMVVKMTDKFFIAKHRPYSDPSDVTLINGIQQVEGMIRQEVQQQKALDEKRRIVREEGPVVGHIGS